MKKAALIVFTIMICLVFQFAMGDVKIVNEMKNIVNGKEQAAADNVSCYKEDRARMEAGGGVTSIVRLDKGVMWLLNDREKTYMEMTPEQMGAMAGLVKDAKDPEIKKTEETKKIGKYNCTKVLITMEMMGQKANTEIWATSDIKVDPTILKFMEKTNEVFKDSPTLKQSNKMMQGLFELKLFPVQTTTKMKMMGMSSESMTLLKSISTEKLDDSLFELPEGYTKQEMPSMGEVKDVIEGKSKEVIKGKAK